MKSKESIEKQVHDNFLKLEKKEENAVKDLKKIIASDKYNLLRDDESRIGYFLLRMRYKIELLLTKEK